MSWRCVIVRVWLLGVVAAATAAGVHAELGFALKSLKEDQTLTLPDGGLLQPYIWDNTRCIGTIFADGILSGTFEGEEVSVSVDRMTIRSQEALADEPCTTWLELDGHYYVLDGEMDRFAGGDVLTDVVDMKDCRSETGELNASTPPRLTTPYDTVPLSVANNEAALDFSAIEGVIWHMDSAPGDVVCDGRVDAPATEAPVGCSAGPDDRIFAGSFESC